MRLGERAGLTDPGRKRRENEDALVLEPPLFAVADGMGGAQAGEVASRLAASAFREFHEADELDGVDRVAAIIKEANRRIYERAQRDRQVAGMGTTVTAALVEGDRVTIGHVGDSRAYRIRDGELEQLTQDHSLVADLVRSGRLTPEEAESHPQRSVITRALGTDPEVDVDTFTVDPAPGDVFLLCSDGLTSMVDDAAILETVRNCPTLESAGEALVKTANRQGGEDNVTVVLFELVDGSVDARGDVMSGNGTVEATQQDLEDTLSGLEAPTFEDVRQADAVGERGGGWASLEETRGEGERRSRWRRPLFWTLLALVVAAILLVGALFGLSNAHFVGAEKDGRVAVYQGIPWELGAGLDLYRAKYVSELQAEQLSRREREALFDHDIVSYETARRRIAGYEREALP